MAAIGKLRQLWKSERGNVLVLGAAVMPLMVGSAALALDTIQMGLWKRQLQRAADSGALAGAYAILQNKAADQAVARDLLLNNDVPLEGGPVVENAPTSGAFAKDPRAVRVVLRTRRDLPFASFFTGGPTYIEAESTAASIFQGEFCMVALETGSASGITFSGNSKTELGCGVATNSRGATAIVADGSARVVAVPVAAVGGIPASSAFVQPTTLLPYSPKQPDPFATLPLPDPKQCQNAFSLQPNTSATITPGCYKGMDIKGMLRLEPGIYYIDGSSFSLGATAQVTGTGVTLVLTSSTPTNPSSFAQISIHGNAQVSLTASTEGPYKDLVFLGDPRAPVGLMNTITGNATSTYQGGMYFRSQDLTFIGNAGMQTSCIQMVARRILLSGSSNIVNSCPEGGPQGFNATFVRLVA